MQRRKRFNQSKKRMNTDYAIMLEWRKCLRLALLWLYENSDTDSEGLCEFVDLFYDYFNAACNNSQATEELDKKFYEFTGLDLSKVSLKGGEISKSIKLVQAISIRVSGVILKEVYGFTKQGLRTFVYGMWDYLKEYPANETRLREMQMETGILVRFQKV